MSRRKKSKQPTQTSRSSLTLDLGSISNDETLSRYWNAACGDLRSRLWCPIEIDWQEPGSDSSDPSLSLTEGQSSRLIKAVMNPNPLTQKISLASSLASVTPTTANEVVAVRKIRIYPDNERLYWRTLHAARRAYNLAIDAHKRRDGRSQTIVRREIVNAVRDIFQDVPAVALDEAVNESYRTKSSIIRRRTSGEKCDYRFRCRKDTKHSFTVQKLSKSGTPYPTLLGGVRLTEEISDRAVGSLADVIYEDGRWFLCAKISVTTGGAESQGLSVAAIDPGVRTFATVFSFDSLAKIGEDFSKNEIYPMAVRLDRLYSERQKLRNICPRRFVDWKQWHWDRWRGVEKRIHRIKNRIKDLTDDLHRRAADWLTDKYDVLLLPTFGVKGMTKRAGRKIRRKTVRAMLMLSHFRFKQYLKWIALKKGKWVVDVNEAYTSKTDSRTGDVKNIGGATKINGLDRDVNGARGILLRALTRQLEPEIITTPAVADVAV